MGGAGRDSRFGLFRLRRPAIVVSAVQACLKVPTNAPAFCISPVWVPAQAGDPVCIEMAGDGRPSQPVRSYWQVKQTYGREGWLGPRYGDIGGCSIEGWEGKCFHATFLRWPGLSEIPLARAGTWADWRSQTTTRTTQEPPTTVLEPRRVGGWQHAWPKTAHCWAALSRASTIGTRDRRGQGREEAGPACRGKTTDCKCAAAYPETGSRVPRDAHGLGGRCCRSRRGSPCA